MSRHEGVSCDSCLKGNFRGKRYKCLICYDYDLCASCYESGATTTRHSTDHPMQCILTRTDFDLYYGGEGLTPEQPQSFTCPYCGKMGFTEASLQEHVAAEHADSSVEVVCPVCASLPGGDPNHVTDDFAAHLTIEHRAPRDFDEASGIRHMRRVPHSGRGVGGMRARRSNMHFSSASSALTGLSPSSRESMDPIAELLSQLSSVRSRAAAAQSVSSQLQQLEMQLQSTRDKNQNRQQLERLPRGQVEAARPNSSGATASVELPSTRNTSNSNSQFLLSRITESTLSDSEQQALDMERADRSLFVQEILLSTLSEKLQLSSDDSDEDLHQGSLGLFNSDRISHDHRKKDNRKKNMVKHVGVDNKKSDKEPPPH
ncbi:E3 ubiquitin-protein ligase KCMF1-like [Lineus longissimus]|uniref:E3 ubiquitin-protein ligase KCMF1-like n=1 Tax=Lineus longissimus TaxID=88925 RepID=UPI002B4E9427